MSAQSRREFADGAMRLARDAAEGRIDPDDMVPAFLDETRELCGQVIGPGDPMWTVQVEITRDVLGLGGIPYDEMVAYVEIARQRSGPWVELGDPPVGIHDAARSAVPEGDRPEETVSPVSVDYGPETVPVEPEPWDDEPDEAEAEPTEPVMVEQTTSAQRSYRVLPGAYAPPSSTEAGFARRLGGNRPPTTVIHNEP